MATTKTVKHDLIPYRSGVVIITPIGTNGNPDYSKSYSTARPFLTSTQLTTTKEYETLPNGNGSDKDYPTSEKHNFAVVTQVYDYTFHNIVAGREVVETLKPVPRDTTITVKKVLEAYEVDLTANEPAPMEDGKYYFIVKDVNGNKLEQTTEEATAGKFKYDSGTKKLSFSADAENLSFSLTYWVAAKEAVAYKSSALPKNQEFLIETFGELQSAETGELFMKQTRLERVTVSGDIPDITKQKSINAPITYNFQTAPMPVGESVLYESLSKFQK